jgi:hypothetical protein
LQLQLTRFIELAMSWNSQRAGELMAEIGMEIKRQSPYSGTLMVTHCNGSSGYIWTDKSFKEGLFLHQASVTSLKKQLFSAIQKLGLIFAILTSD